MAGIPREQLLKELLPGLSELFGIEYERYDEVKWAEKYPIRVSQAKDKWYVGITGNASGAQVTYGSFEELPEWIREKIYVVQITDADTEVESFGIKSKFGGYYLAENKNENSNV